MLEMRLEKSKIVNHGIFIAAPAFILALDFYRTGLSWRIPVTLGMFVSAYVIGWIISRRKAD
jgi:hypothetical protein